MKANHLTQEDLKRYREDGYLLIRGMLSGDEVELLGRTARQDRILAGHAQGRADGEGGTVRLSLWNHPTDTIYGAIARAESMVGYAEQILEGEVYHYHSKMIMKDAKVEAHGHGTRIMATGIRMECCFLCLPAPLSPLTRPSGNMDACR